MDQALADRDRANRLVDAYGALLTERQRQLLRRYFEDDLSLGEIATQVRVSRQAVHDGLRRALGALERYDTALGLVARAQRRKNPAGRRPHPAGQRSRPTGEHYSARAPQSHPRPRVFQAALRGRAWSFHAAAGVFSQRGVDPGTRLLIDTMLVNRADQVLDLGCGYGPIGLVAASLATRGTAWLVDANQRAAALAAANAASHGLRNVRVIVADGASSIRDGTMDVVITNPPIRAGRRVVAGFITDAWRVLRPGGRFYLVARSAQGARTLGRLIEERFGMVRQVRAAGGYRVYEAERARAGGVRGDRRMAKGTADV